LKICCDFAHVTCCDFLRRLTFLLIQKSLELDLGLQLPLVSFDFQEIAFVIWQSLQ
jgi:hypothetical protein